MPLVNGSRYWFANLLYDLAGDFFVFYLRGLHRFDFSGHFITSFLNIAGFGGDDKPKIPLRGGIALVLPL